MAPWREIPEWFYDKKPVSQQKTECDDALKAHAGVQNYFGRNISRRAVDEFLFGDGIGGTKVISVHHVGSSETLAVGKLTLEAVVILPGGNEGIIRHTFDRQGGKVSFDSMKPEKNTERFPRGFGREYFTRYIPLLRELGIREIDIQASSVPSSGMNGGYTWCFYGFTNRNMRGTLQEYILYLEDYHGIFLDGKRRSVIMELGRMKRLLIETHAEEFLKGKKRGSLIWSGYIPDISNENTIEMRELIDYLRGDM